MMDQVKLILEVTHIVIYFNIPNVNLENVFLPF